MQKNGKQAVKENSMDTYLRNVLSKYNQIYIAGAQSRAKAVTGYISELFPDVSVKAYLADDCAENESVIQGIPVYVLGRHPALDCSLPVLIATKGIYHNQISQQLQKIGFRIVIPVTPDIDTWFRNEYVQKIFQKEKRKFIRLDSLIQKDMPANRKTVLDACIYMAQSAADKPLKAPYKCPLYEKPVHAGAALTDRKFRKDMLTDCTGENISYKNRQYCELTVLYWIWKHASNDIIGLSHYRRHFILPDDWVSRMETEQIDVILPVPAYIAPSISENYKERHDASDWEYLMEYLKIYYPDDYKLAEQVFSGNLYLTCNMLIARKSVLNELCEWLFPILDAAASHGGKKADAYADRYPGFISERLFTLFFEKYWNKYKIVYADKIFIA